MAGPRLRYAVAMSLDGFIAPPEGGPAWLEPYMAAASDMGEFMKEIGGAILGRATWDEAVKAGAWGGMPTAVMTSRALEGAPASVETHTDPRAALASVADRLERGDIWLFGGGRAATPFLEAGLIDTLELGVVPILLGSGQPLFERPHSQARWERVACSATGAGGVRLIYRRAG